MATMLTSQPDYNQLILDVRISGRLYYDPEQNDGSCFRFCAGNGQRSDRDG